MTGDPRLRTLVLAMGNDILGDDAAGILAARRLQGEFADHVDFVETAEAGLALMELMHGYDRALLLDSVMTGQTAVGEVVEFSTDAFRRVIAPSPHYAGLPEVLALAGRLDIPFPTEIRILAIEVADPFTLREGLTPEVELALPAYIQRARSILDEWSVTGSCMNTR